MTIEHIRKRVKSVLLKNDESELESIAELNREQFIEFLERKIEQNNQMAELELFKETNGEINSLTEFYGKKMSLNSGKFTTILLENNLLLTNLNELRKINE
ncbi:hypothetical protein AB9K26_00925 [Psychroserpens sp. XS_ASV72]|uniref:hypothetical protein n=1 Tax=Psychroserpens sp. XS_ASV72 TaxID=3241293 RepID=UPI0035139C06